MRIKGVRRYGRGWMWVGGRMLHVKFKKCLCRICLCHRGIPMSPVDSMKLKKKSCRYNLFLMLCG